MSENCPIDMAENFCLGSGNRFVKELQTYNNEPHLTDVIFGVKGKDVKAHLTLSGAIAIEAIGSVTNAVLQTEIIGSDGIGVLREVVGSENGALWFLRDEANNKVLLGGSIVKNISQ